MTHILPYIFNGLNLNVTGIKLQSGGPLVFGTK